jgi:hypothetical protein
MRRTVSTVYDVTPHCNIIRNGGLFCFLWYPRDISKLRDAF